jgi:hypothetical protein
MRAILLKGFDVLKELGAQRCEIMESNEQIGKIVVTVP